MESKGRPQDEPPSATSMFHSGFQGPVMKGVKLPLAMAPPALSAHTSFSSPTFRSLATMPVDPHPHTLLEHSGKPWLFDGSGITSHVQHQSFGQKPTLPSPTSSSKLSLRLDKLAWDSTPVNQAPIPQVVDRNLLEAFTSANVKSELSPVDVWKHVCELIGDLGYQKSSTSFFVDGVAMSNKFKYKNLLYSKDGTGEAAVVIHLFTVAGSDNLVLEFQRRWGQRYVFWDMYRYVLIELSRRRVVSNEEVPNFNNMLTGAPFRSVSQCTGGCVAVVSMYGCKFLDVKARAAAALVNLCSQPIHHKTLLENNAVAVICSGLPYAIRGVQRYSLSALCYLAVHEEIRADILSGLDSSLESLAKSRTPHVARELARLLSLLAPTVRKQLGSSKLAGVLDVLLISPDGATREFAGEARAAAA